MDRVPIPTLFRDVKLRIIHPLHGVPEQRHDARVAVAREGLAEVVEAMLIMRLQDIRRLSGVVASAVVEMRADSILCVT